MSVFDYVDYKEFVRAQVKQMPKGGHGMFQKIAKSLGIHSTMVSHIFNGEKEMNADQALILARFFGLSENQTDYLILLVQRQRAGTPAFKNRLTKQLEKCRKGANDLAKVLPKDTASMSKMTGLLFIHIGITALSGCYLPFRHIDREKK